MTVGVVDDGVNTALSAFKDQIDLANSKDFGTITTGGVTTARNSLGDTQSDHGTAVAAIIAARRDGDGTMGIAPDAKIAVLRISNNNADKNTEELIHVLQAVDFATTKGIKILNMSLSNNGSTLLGSAVTRYGVTGGLVVKSTGNEGGANPIDTGSVTDANRQAFLFVTAINGSLTEYATATYANKAGTMMDRTVTAVGTNVTTKVDGTVATFSGTSSATPQVSALAATILSKWPQLTGQQAGEVILGTARDIGAPGTDAIFGRGLIDVKAALSPVNPTLSNGSKQTSLQTSVMAVPDALGATSLQTALANVTVLDAYGRDFSGSMANMVIKADAKDGHWLRRRMLQMGAGGYSDLSAGNVSGGLGFANYRTGPNRGDVRSVVTTGRVDYRMGDTSFHGGFNAQNSLQSDIMGLAAFSDGVLAYAPQAGNTFGVDRITRAGKVGFTVSTGAAYGGEANAATLSWSAGGTSVRASLIDEKDSVMGMPSQGALKLGRGATTTMIEAHHAFTIAGGWSLEGYGSIGYTTLKIDSASLVTDATALVGTRLGLQASGPMFGGIVSFGVAQPLNIESGSARLTYGSGYDAATRSLVYSNADADLTSAVRRVQITAGFAKGTARSNLRVGMMQDLAQGDTRAVAGYSLRF